MDQYEWLAERFQEHRPRLRALAYRMLGSTSEAEDALQEAWIRLSRSNASEIDNLEAWLVSVVGRVALNMLRSRKRRRGEEPLEAQHLPEPIVDRQEGIDPEHEALLADSVGLALLVVLETLTQKVLRTGGRPSHLIFGELRKVEIQCPKMSRMRTSR